MSGKRKEITWIVTDSGCHECTSHALDTHGYPMLWKSGRNQHMHRVLYEESNGDLGELVARHTCDNRKCINLDHIVPGTCAENSNDAKIRGRLNTHRGETRADSKLTREQVLEIRASKETQVNLSIRYNVDSSYISRIKSGEKRKYDI